MKKILLASGLLTAALGCTPAYASGSVHAPAQAPAMVLTNETGLNVGVSIGTVNAQNYYDSGLNFGYFSSQYVAQTSENTWLGFDIKTELRDETDQYGDITSVEAYCASLSSIKSSDEAVTIPDYIHLEYDGQEIDAPVTSIESYYYLYNGFINSPVRHLTIPATVDYIYLNYNFDINLEDMYMLGAAPEITSTLRVPTIYVCDKQHFTSYTDNKYFAQRALLPYGWDFEWATVDVVKPGEFAETYLTQNDYDWGAVQYLKVTGNINTTDLSAIKNVSSLMKLDLSETTITSIPENFMQGKTSLTEVRLPETLTSIGDYAFSNCRALKSFDLNSINSIGNYVFSYCSSLEYINLNGVESIGAAAFDSCTRLNNLDLSTVKTISSSAFNGCSSLESVNLASVQSLEGASFRNCSALKSVELSNSLTSIGNSSFASTGLESITIPEGVTTIGNYAFENCDFLLSAMLPKSLKTIGNEAFCNCGLVDVNMNTGVTTIGYRAFYGCSNLEEISIPATVTQIGNEAFSNTNIKTFKCYAAVPPTATGSFIGGDMDMSRTYLYVPPFSKDFYRNTQYWSNFYLMRSLEDPVDYINVDRPLTINLEEEDNEAVANNPTIELSYQYYSSNNNTVGQLTATGEGTLSAGQLTVTAQLTARSNYNYYNYCPTLINYADKMRADNVTHQLTFGYNNTSSSGKWYFISLPYDVKVADIVPSSDTYWVIRRYDSAARAAGETSETWVDLTKDDTLEAGKGYIVSAAGGETYYDESYGSYRTANPRLTFTSGNSLTKNNIFRSTDVIVPLSEYTAEFAHNRSWNFIGNPYPCYFNMQCLNEEFTAPVTVWNGSSYVAYSPVDDELVLAPYEAFFVQCPLDATEMTFKESGRMHSDEGKAAYKAPARLTNVSAAERNVFNFAVSGDRADDRTRIVLNPEATADYEIGRDAVKFFGGNEAGMQIYVSGDVCYSICERPAGEGTATLGVRAAKESVATLSLNGRFSSDWSVILTDNATGNIVDLTKEDYEFTAAAGDNISRFSINFELGDMTGIEGVNATFGADAEVTVTAVNGVVVYSGSLSGMTTPAAGIYLISDGKQTRKAILK